MIKLLQEWRGICFSIAVALIVTAIMVGSGLDWVYFVWVQSLNVGIFLMTAAATVLGLAISMALESVTGRVSPPPDC